MKEKDLEYLKQTINMPPEMADSLIQGCVQSRRKRGYYNCYVRLCAVFAPFLFIIAIGSTSFAAYHVYQDKCLAAFMDSDLTQAQIEAIGAQIMNNPDVAVCRFVSGEEAWEEFKDKYLDNDPELTGSFCENPLKDSFHYEVRVKLGGDEKAVKRQLRKISGIRLVSVRGDLDSPEDFESVAQEMDMSGIAKE